VAWGLLANAAPAWQAVADRRAQDLDTLQQCERAWRRNLDCDEAAARAAQLLLVHYWEALAPRVDWCKPLTQLSWLEALVSPRFIYLAVFVLALPSLLRLLERYTPRVRRMRKWTAENAT
jgi:hypothetical protein